MRVNAFGTRAFVEPRLERGSKRGSGAVLALAVAAAAAGLAALVIAPMRLQQVASAFGQGDCDVAMPFQLNRANETLFTEVSKVACVRIKRPVIVVAQIARRHDAEVADDALGHPTNGDRRKWRKTLRKSPFLVNYAAAQQSFRYCARRAPATKFSTVG